MLVFMNCKINYLASATDDELSASKWLYMAMEKEEANRGLSLRSFLSRVYKLCIKLGIALVEYLSLYDQVN